jgi:energy-coupling factor transporter ATP-binding protein EcfA2
MPIAAALPPPEAFYDPAVAGKCIYIRNSRNSFIPITGADFKRYLKNRGFSNDTDEAHPVSEVDQVIDVIQTTKDVEYAGPLAGHNAGEYEMQNRRVLVTEGPRMVEPVPGTWATLEALLRGLLVPDEESADVGESQLWVFYSWLKVALTALRAGKRRPGQVLVIAGPPACGKSLLQNLLTQLFGGRSAKPYQYLSGATQFNSELFHAEHLMIEDETASFELRVRRQLGANLKSFVVNESQRCHPKNRQALTLYPWWRMSITLNDEAESLMVLPPLDESLQDKLLLFRAFKRDMPMPTETLEQWGAFMAQLEADLSGFVYYLLHHWQVPTDMRNERYGVTHFHHPELLEMMNVLSPEAKLMELIDVLQPWQNAHPDEVEDYWEGRAAELEVKLTGPNSSVSYEARKLLIFNSACGQYLGRLVSSHPQRISKRLLEGHTRWKIVPPPSEVAV